MLKGKCYETTEQDNGDAESQVSYVLKKVVKTGCIEKVTSGQRIGDEYIHFLWLL